MIRSLLGNGGLFVVLVPRRVIELYENLAIENPEECPPKDWVAPAIRAEGIGLVILSLLGGKGFSAFMKVGIVAGTLATIFPRQYAAFGFGVAWKQPDSIQWKAGFIPALRVMGAFSVLFSYFALKEQRSQ